MHVPLDEHLHSEECNIVIRQLLACHEETSMVSSELAGLDKNVDIMIFLVQTVLW